MSKKPQNRRCAYQTKLLLTALDFDIITTGMFDKSRTVVAHVNEVYKMQEKFVYVDIKPMYLLDTTKERMIRKRTIAGPDIYYLLLLGDAATVMLSKWNSSVRQSCFLIIFIVIQMPTFSCQNGKHTFKCGIMVPKNTVIVTDEYTQYENEVSCTMSMDNLEIPESTKNIIKHVPDVEVKTMLQANAKDYVNYIMLCDQLHSTVKEKLMKQEDILKSSWAQAIWKIQYPIKPEPPPELIIEVREQVKLRGLYDRNYLCKWATKD